MADKYEDGFSTKAFKFDIKEVSDTGEFEGIASIYGVKDLGDDIIDAGAFSKTISENPEVPILLLHGRQNGVPIGSGSVTEDGNIIRLKGHLDMEDPEAIRVHGKLKKKLLKGLSIGFQPIKWIMEETKEAYIRHITELKLFEVSVVTFPMLPQAQVTSVKDVIADLADIKAGRAISAEREKRLRTAANEILALLDEAGLSTSGDGAAGKSTEPEIDHSLLEQLIISLKGE